MENIAENLLKTRARIVAAEQKYDRPEGSVSLLAVSKTHAADTIRIAVAAGQHHFGENYLQEALEKIGVLPQTDLIWHFIGPVQTNKTRQLAENFHWVHCVDRFKVAKRLSESRPVHLAPLNICIQVNISGESTKSGVATEQVAELARQILPLPGLSLRGLMVIPAPQSGFELQRVAFRQTRLLIQELNATGMQLDTLSMGMSDDLEAAIAEGATMVRIGTAIFGSRQT